MSTFLQGVALRGAGLYAAATPRQVPGGQSPAGLIEVIEEPVTRIGAQGPSGEDAPLATLPDTPETTAGKHRSGEAHEAATVSARPTPPLLRGGEALDLPHKHGLKLEPHPAPKAPGMPMKRSSGKATAPQTRHAVKDEFEQHKESQTVTEPSLPRSEVQPARPVGLTELKTERLSAPAVLLRPAATHTLILMGMPAGGQHMAALSDLEPRPVEVRIGSIEVRGSATGQPKTQTPPKTAPRAESGFGAYLRMRTYRSQPR